MKTDYYFEYDSFLVDTEDLKEKLNLKGLDSWRLHTCEPITTFHKGSSGIANKVFVVMDRGPIYRKQEETTEEEEIKDYSDVVGMQMD